MTEAIDHTCACVHTDTHTHTHLKSAITVTFRLILKQLSGYHNLAKMT